MQYLQKSLWNEVDFLPADKRVSFLQDDSFSLGVHSQACSKYSKQQVYNVFAISLLQCLCLSQIIQNNKFANSLQCFKKEVSDKVHFLHADKHESLLQMVS